jgi:hypothetical protein
MAEMCPTEGRLALGFTGYKRVLAPLKTAPSNNAQYSVACGDILSATLNDWPVQKPEIFFGKIR